MNSNPVQPTRLSYRRRDWLWLAATFLICVAYTYLHLMRGWVPHDEGTLALSAERVLKGEIPHRDFQEVYTAGLTYLHALAFKLLGIKLSSLRWVVFLFFAAWVPAVFAVARRFTDSSAAAALAILATTWSLPNYPASMPSWYNLFFATFGIWATFRFLESQRAAWLFCTGVCAGASVCVKISGAYFIVAVLFFFIYCEQGGHGKNHESRPRRGAFAAILSATMLLTTAAVFRMVRPLLDPLFFANFVFPASVLAGTIVWRELTSCNQASRTRLHGLFNKLIPFVAGAIVPCILLLIPYLRTGSLRLLVRGLVVAPQTRLAFASQHYLAGASRVCNVSGCDRRVGDRDHLARSRKTCSPNHCTNASSSRHR